MDADRVGFTVPYGEGLAVPYGEGFADAFAFPGCIAGGGLAGEGITAIAGDTIGAVGNA